MEDNAFHITFDSDGKHYEGRVNPSEKTHDDGRPASFHVVLNHVHFGHLPFTNNKWLVDEQHPAQLVADTGDAISQHYGWHTVHYSR